MERFKVLGEDLRGHYKRPDVKLHEVFRDIERELKAEQRVVCQYIVNGMALEEKDESRFASFILSDVMTLEYVSEKTEHLLLDVIDSWLKAIPELQTASEAFAERIRTGKVQGLNKSLHDLVENCEFLAESLNSARGLVSDGLHDQPAFAAVEKQTTTAIKEALRHLEGQDFVQLGLVIEYDLNDSLQAWSNLLKGLRQRLGTPGDANDGQDATHSVDRGRGSN